MITIPRELADAHAQYNGDAGRAWIAALPGLAERMLDRWGLRPAGPVRSGVVALVLPVTDADGRRAALKLQPADDETGGEPLALRAWNGNGAVRLLAHDPDSGSLLLEALDPDHSLDGIPDTLTALRPLTELLGRLSATPPPPGLRHLRDMAHRMVARTPDALPRLARDDERRLLADCAAATRELLTEPGEALLHWDLHYQNVLAPLPGTERGEPWLAIDPKPLVGDVGFELLPAIHNRFDPDETLRRFDLMTGILSLDRARAKGWTLARVLQNCLWSLTDGDSALPPVQKSVAEALLTQLS
ncbi:aminoglycoside phosphotransferase family protein [Streptomyces litchfieldiae]|uniref:Aminoglycoside phosphotransferase family protein n=1 Tax=Streptomyces litchfieldiae TaxID=3075543 RepID=A0ABU2MRP0_9ACTN|nr:aminoglycoside phosphotransferase family protein [Streptomyces sp. DSM 44938]MDT0343269.1 aminoglycoside phosphotransferase family protein [Streptomyces sp. DSM 44938]